MYIYIRDLNLAITVFADGHYNGVIMSAMTSWITNPAIVHSDVYSGTDHRKVQSSVSLALVRGIHRWLVNSPHKGLVTRKKFPFDDFIMPRSVCYHSVGDNSRHVFSMFARCRGISSAILNDVIQFRKVIHITFLNWITSFKMADESREISRHFDCQDIEFTTHLSSRLFMKFQ